MVRWFVNKQHKVPLYLQLTDLVEYYVSTGALAAGERLPTVDELAAQLKITFETVRKSYKELERRGFINTARGRGTFINSSSARPIANGHKHPAPALQNAIGRLFRQGFSAEEIRHQFERALEQTATDTSRHVVIFTECNETQLQAFTGEIRSQLGMLVRPALISRLKQEIARARRDSFDTAAVLTTGFHIDEVRRKLHGTNIPVEFVITRMSPKTRRKLDEFDKSSIFGFICRDEKSIPLYRDLLKTELELTRDLECCTLAERQRLKQILRRVSVLLVSPTAFDELRGIVPSGFPIFNVFDWIDPVSLQIVKARFTRK